MNRLIVCVTVYQLFNAMNFRKSLFCSDDKVDLILIDKTNFSDIVKKLDEDNLFNNVYYIKSDKFYKDLFTKYFNNNKFLKKIFLSSRIDLLNYNKMIKHYFKDSNFNGVYDEIYIANYMRITNILYNYLIDRNKNLKVFEYEDGLGSYVLTREKFKFLKDNSYVKLLNVLGTKTLLPKLISGLYLYKPELYCKKDDLVKLEIPKFDKNNLKNITLVNKIFDYKENDFFDRKYILFEQPFKEDRVIANDYELFEEIINQLGEENIIIKIHPRSKENRFNKFKNIKIYDEITPWEIMCMNESFTGKVLITVSSSAIFTPILLYKENCCAVSLCKMLESNHLDDYSKNIEEYFNKIEEIYGNSCLLPETMEEFFMHIKKLKIDGEV